MSDVAVVIIAQVDLLWSVALALLVAEVYLIARFLARSFGNLGLAWKFLLGASLTLLAVSMLFGYLTYGAAVEMVRLEAASDNSQQSYEDAAFSAVVQFGCFTAGLFIFLVAFFVNSESFGKAINNG